LTSSPKKILIIRLSALGDIVLSFPAFAAIRAHHPATQITLLTTAPYAQLLGASPWFDHLEIDARPKWWNFTGLSRLTQQLRGYDMVYDLQTSSRTSHYFDLAGRPQWSGIAAGCSHPDTNKNRDFIHTAERQHGQLSDAGIDNFPAPNLDFLRSHGPVIATPYIVLVPGTSGAHEGAKTWPLSHFRTLAATIAAQNFTPVIVGAKHDHPAVSEANTTIDLSGRTNLLELAGVLARAHAVIGADTGPLHLAAALDTNTLTLFGPATDPNLTAPRSPTKSHTTVLRAEKNMSDLTPDRVAAALLGL